MTGNALLAVCTWMPCQSDYIACIHLATNRALDDPRPSDSIRHARSWCSPESTWNVPNNPARSMKQSVAVDLSNAPQLLWLPMPCSPKRVDQSRLLRRDPSS
ncbi:uncharacterized protein CC84DRAFT_840694 [Paraphaeosphaeria sporulosa]|uniref:Uncharacterized protein n=1 Tax=Paraphaeosphaeria sporulosa TaxID=1460663 RepID=A0A177C9C1_9PLEO|nr:uncharacterized protein CC84DRAFT_840694 [Paraphaeosphaeria sporulosa]OAG03452.1 hypothetical protein CC84DRAFT_840694 [Paraphaeosphaeria sporulosa]